MLNIDDLEEQWRNREAQLEIPRKLDKWGWDVLAELRHLREVAVCFRGHHINPEYSQDGENCPACQADRRSDDLWEALEDQKQITRDNAVRAQEDAGKLVPALRDARRAIESLPIDALGEGRDGEMVWPLRDELLDKINKLVGAEAP